MTEPSLRNLSKPSGLDLQFVDVAQLRLVASPSKERVENGEKRPFAEVVLQVRIKAGDDAQYEGPVQTVAEPKRTSQERLVILGIEPFGDRNGLGVLQSIEFV